MAAVAATTPFLDHSAIVYPEGVGRAEAERECNDVVGLENEGYIVIGESNDFSCLECTRLTERPGGCEATERVGGKRATGRRDSEPDRRDGCVHKAGRGYECMACTGRQAFGPISPLTSATIHISSDCHHVEPGGNARIQLNRTMHNVTLLGHGGTAVLDNFPVNVGANFTAIDVTFALLEVPPTEKIELEHKHKKKVARGHEARFRSALAVQQDGNLTLIDAHAPSADALVTIRPKHPRDVDVKMSAVSVRGSARLFVAAVSHISVPKNTIRVFCTDPKNRVATQQLQNDRPLVLVPFPDESDHAGESTTTTTLTTTTTTSTTETTSSTNPGEFTFEFNDGTNCTEPLDVAKLLAIYGKHYEVEFYNEGEYQQEADPWLKSAVRYLSAAVAIMSITLFLGHEGDARRMYRYLVLHKKLHHD